MYWLGWMPVMAVNMILTGSYLPVLFGFTLTGWWAKERDALRRQLAGDISDVVVGAVLSEWCS